MGVGDVVAVDAPGHVTIRHDAIDGLTRAATTQFAADTAAIGSIGVGQRVRFELVQRDTQVRVTKVTALEEGNPGVHDHTPHHGGVVAMVGMVHLEARAERDGRVLLYLTDRFRRPLPISDAHGSVTFSLPTGKATVPLRVRGDALEASGPTLSGGDVNVGVELVSGQRNIEMTFQLPLANTVVGAAGIPADGCRPVVKEGQGERLPRCVLQFPRPVGVLAASPDHTRLFVATADIGVSVWHIESGRFLLGFEPPPAVAMAQPEPHHIEIANALEVRRDGKRVVVALENRLMTYEADTGRLIEARAHPQGIVRAVAWMPTDDELLVTAFYDPAARLIGSGDGVERRSFAVEREAAAVTCSEDGSLVAVASERGAIEIFSRETGALIRALVGATLTTRSVAFVGTGVIAASDDGLLRWWDLTQEVPPVVLATAVSSAMARSADGKRVASAKQNGSVGVYDIAGGALVAELRWHRTPATALAWAGQRIISADAAGQVLFWDAP